MERPSRHPDSRRSSNSRRNFFETCRGVRGSNAERASSFRAGRIPVVVRGSRRHANMINDMTFEDVRKLLDLSPNATCGYVRVTFASKHKIAPGGMASPVRGWQAGLDRALYFMLTPQEPVKLHTIRNDQLYHYYLGDPIESADDAGRWVHPEFHIVGPDLRKGHKVQLLYSGRYLSHRAHCWRAALVPRHLNRMARREAAGRRTWQRRSRWVTKYPQVAAGNPELPGAGEAIERQLRSLTRAGIQCTTLYFPLTQRRAGSSAG